jgi:cobalamin biosynthesis protein CobD/CbiB
MITKKLIRFLSNSTRRTNKKRILFGGTIGILIIIAVVVPITVLFTRKTDTTTTTRVMAINTGMAVSLSFTKRLLFISF